MKKISIVTALLLGSPEAIAATVSPEAFQACEKEYRAKLKEGRAAAPAGYRLVIPRGMKADFIAQCLSK